MMLVIYRHFDMEHLQRECSECTAQAVLATKDRLRGVCQSGSAGAAALQHVPRRARHFEVPRGPAAARARRPPPADIRSNNALNISNTLTAKRLTSCELESAEYLSNELTN
ncbi:hypothetical protein EVAR_33627_1 [Eumeta japonica]|uniref:Uncharacterized protein n=1 Tax=Eumeta variegata TaxID=151549 RepID=A0A4C1WAL1_EUMVA|nr:hypothetical protein EVAR_33627_1 [Eumeta japonica]